MSKLISTHIRNYKSYYLSRRSYSSSGLPQQGSGQAFTINNVRNTFLNYFEKNQHKRVESSSLIPDPNDKTLLFTNAGMVQFKNQFVGLEEPKNRLVTSVQRCVRAGGKHNDLENVGYTARHHTFFEMLGNFSFGGYADAKRDSIRHAWDLLTNHYHLPKERLLVTVLEGDEEAAKIWREEIGVPSERVLYKGKEDNFWSMGDGPGPCGPCSEIFWDYGEGNEVDGERYLEIWNLVFMQYQRMPDGSLQPLPKISVDTGMGLERMTSVLQGKKTNYEIDLFQNLIGRFRELVDWSKVDKKIYSEEKIETACRVIIDHLRSISFLIGDGVIPLNIGRGYVLRKIIRRALSYGMMLGFNSPFLHRLVPLLVAEMGDTYRLIKDRSTEIQNVISNEELTFYSAIQRGIPLLKESIEQGRFNEDMVFHLYQTFGLPLEISEVSAKQNNITIDMVRVNELINQTRELSRSSSTVPGKDGATIPDPVLKWKNDSDSRSTFTGYTHDLKAAQTATISKLHLDTDEHMLYLSLDASKFYANSGGQVGDTGLVVSPSGAEYRVINTIKPFENSIVLIVELDPLVHNYPQVIKDLAVGTSVQTKIHSENRKQTAVHHTATHLLHAALKAVLGKSVNQAGSLVGPDLLRFDFTYPSKLSAKQLEDIEAWVNGSIEQDVHLHTEVLDYSEVNSQSDIVQLFSEKYQDKVRVVQVPGFSKELCGGTHVERTSDLHHFKILSESSIAAGIRRIEAVAGKAATHFYRSYYQSVQSLSERYQFQSLDKSYEKLVQSGKDQEKLIAELQLKLALASATTAHGRFLDLDCCVHYIDCDDKKILNNLANSLGKQHSQHSHFILTSSNKLILCVGGDQLKHTQADHQIKALLQHLGKGKGGGGRNLAQASFADCSVHSTTDLLSEIYKSTNCCAQPIPFILH